MPREMLKLRKGDSAIMIKSDGSIEMAGVNDKPLMDDKGMISPVILFAAAWAKKDHSVLKSLVDNFKNCVREGYFGQDAKNDLLAIEAAAASGAVTQQTPAVKANATPEEIEKMRIEDERLQQLANRKPDPRVERQMAKMKAGAKSITTKEYEGHKEPDLPLEQTFKFQNATPEEQEKMRNTASGVVTLEPVVGTATIEEGVDNENQ